MDDRATLNSSVRIRTADGPQTLPARPVVDARPQRSSEPASRDAKREQTVLVDQAIFTSSRSPMGEGYRIVAATTGITPAERAEITRRSPSHGSLYDDQPSAVALSAYPLGSGRHCLAVSRPAGIEHSGRGGQCIRTHIAVLDDDAYRAFACNPVAAHSAIPQAEGPGGNLPPTLDRLRLSIPKSVAPRNSGALGIDWLLSLSGELLRGERLIVAGVSEETAALDALVSSLPLAVRRKLSVSCGLRYAAARRLQLSFVARDRGDLQRAVRGQDVQCHDITAPPPSAHASYESWLRLLRRWFEAGRAAQVASLAAALTEDVSATTLNCIARIWTHIDAMGDGKSGPPMPSAAL